MDIKEKQNEDKQEKKLSRTTLTFYIIGLCSVAIALILISYILQARNDRQLANLTTKLSEQQTVAQGATEKMADLQRQLDMMTVEIAQARQQLGTGDAISLSESIENLQKREKLLEMLLQAEEAERVDDINHLTAIMDAFIDAFSSTELKLQAEGGLFKEEEYAAYQALLEAETLQMEETNEEEDEGVPPVVSAAETEEEP